MNSFFPFSRLAAIPFCILALFLLLFFSYPCQNEGSMQLVKSVLSSRKCPDGTKAGKECTLHAKVCNTYAQKCQIFTNEKKDKKSGKRRKFCCPPNAINFGTNQLSQKQKKASRQNIKMTGQCPHGGPPGPACSKSERCKDEGNFCYTFKNKSNKAEKESFCCMMSVQQRKAANKNQ